MKKVFPFLFVVLCSHAVLGQRPIATVPYGNQFVQLCSLYAKEPDDVSNLIDMATFFSQPDNPQFSLPQAYGYIARAEEVFTKWLDDKDHYRDLQKLIRRGVSIATIRQQRADIQAAATAYVKAHVWEMDASETSVYEELLANSADIVKLLRAKALDDDYAKICDENTLNGYYAFLLAHPNTAKADSAEVALSQKAALFFSAFPTEALVDSVAARYAASPSMQNAAMRQKSRIAYIDACRINTVESYSSYLERYPRGDYYHDALSRLQTLRSIDYTTLATPYELADFVDANSDDPLSDSALAKLRHIVVVDHNQIAARVYLSRFPLDEYYSSVYREYYSWYSAEGNKGPIETFAAENPDYPYQLTISSDLARGAMIDTFDLTKPFVESDLDCMSSCLHLLTGRKAAFVALQRVLQQKIAAKNWAAAQQRAKEYEICFDGTSSEEYNELLSLLSNTSASPVTLELSADSIHHVIAQGDRLYFTRVGKRGSTICYAVRADRKKGGWRYAGNVEVKGCKGSPTAYSFYDGGTKVLLGIAGDIWSARVVDDTTWSLVEKFAAPVNTPYVEMDAVMLDDDLGILLASDRPGGFNVQRSGSYFHGDTALASDIYFIPRESGRWGEAVNLGSRVNTPYCESSPLLSRNLHTLYFVTDARGLGYGDVYCVTRTDVCDWTHWSAPVSLGRNVNGPFRESALSFSPDECRIFLTTNSPLNTRAVQPPVGQNVCYSFPVRHDTTDSRCTVNLYVDSVVEVLRSLDIVDVSSRQSIGHIGWDADTMLPCRLYKGRLYALVPQTDWLYTPTLLVDDASPSAVHARGLTLDQLRQLPEPLPLSLVRFHRATSRLLDISEKELTPLLAFLQQHATSKIEITVHVPGSDDAACYDLSLDRAKSIRTFFVENEIAPDRVSISAYGNVFFKKKPLQSEVFVRFR